MNFNTQKCYECDVQFEQLYWEDLNAKKLAFFVVFLTKGAN